MPIIESSFRPPIYLSPPSVQTILPAVLRRVTLQMRAEPEILELPDGDFLELNWFYPAPSQDRRSLVVLTHGLEGSSNSTYMRGLARTLLDAGFSVMMWNMRGCGESRNRLPTWYHSGQSSDLRAVVHRALQRFPTHSLLLVGFSVGGNILCKYLGEEGASVPRNLALAIAISAPLDLRGSASILSHPSRALYMQYLLKPLRARMREKAQRFPNLFDISRLRSIRTFYEFDDRFTAPAHGFQSVEHYWESSSGARFLNCITVPTILISACDDPFLSPECYPRALAQASTTLHLETPPHGGHVGFFDSFTQQNTWLERRVLEYCDRIDTSQSSGLNIERTKNDSMAL
jgi:predicted alpha/beta-fold hydrolase